MSNQEAQRPLSSGRIKQTNPLFTSSKGSAALAQRQSVLLQISRAQHDSKRKFALRLAAF